MSLLTKLDALAAILAAVTGLAMAEDRNRSEISPPVMTAEALTPKTLPAETLTPETCAELAEYQRRAFRVTMILAGGLPDIDPPDADRPGRLKVTAPECATPAQSTAPPRGASTNQ